MLGVTRINRRGAQCLPEQPLALADNCAFKSKANYEELAFATASPASKGQAVSSRHWPASPLRSKSSVSPPSTFESGIKEPSSYSGSAQFVELPSSTLKKVTTIPWVSQLVPSLTQPSQRLKFRSMTAAGTRGFSCRQARSRSTKIPLDQKLCLHRTDSEVTPSSCYVPFAMMSGRTPTERHEDFQSSDGSEISVTIGHQVNEFKRLTVLHSRSIYRFSQIATHSSFKALSKQRESRLLFLRQ
jgi:hypothetical protein